MKQQGFSILEVLITVFVMTVGMLGVTGMQLNSLKNNQNAYYRTQVNLLTSDILDRMRSNMGQVEDGGAYDDVDTGTGIPADPGCSGAAGGCTPAEIAALDIREWAMAIQNSTIIPGASGTVAIDASNNVTVTLNWNENEYDQNANDASKVIDVKDLTITVRM